MKDGILSTNNRRTKTFLILTKVFLYGINQKQLLTLKINGTKNR